MGKCQIYIKKKFQNLIFLQKGGVSLRKQEAIDVRGGWEGKMGGENDKLTG